MKKQLQEKFQELKGSLAYFYRKVDKISYLYFFTLLNNQRDSFVDFQRNLIKEKIFPNSLVNKFLVGDEEVLFKIKDKNIEEIQIQKSISFGKLLNLPDIKVLNFGLNENCIYIRDENLTGEVKASSQYTGQNCLLFTDELVELPQLKNEYIKVARQLGFTGNNPKYSIYKQYHTTFKKSLKWYVNPTFNNEIVRKKIGQIFEKRLPKIKDKALTGDKISTYLILSLNACGSIETWSNTINAVEIKRIYEFFKGI